MWDEILDSDGAGWPADEGDEDAYAQVILTVQGHAPLFGSARLARRALDYLVGFTLSPILWRKLPGSRSAGRVQSVALRLVTEREEEIEKFRPQEYWSVVARMQHDGTEFDARLVTFDGQKLERLSIGDKGMADRAKAAVDTNELPRHIATEAPRAAPEAIPSVYGSASGLASMPCSTTPEIARHAPAPMLESRRGRRTALTASSC